MNRLKPALRKLWIEIRKVVSEPRLILPVTRILLGDLVAKIIPGPLPPEVRWPALATGPAYTLILITFGWVPDPAFLMAIAATWAAGIWGIRGAVLLLYPQVLLGKTNRHLQEIRCRATGKPAALLPPIESLEAEMWVQASRGDRAGFEQSARQLEDLIWTNTQR